MSSEYDLHIFCYLLFCFLLCCYKWYKEIGLGKSLTAIFLAETALLGTLNSQFIVRLRRCHKCSPRSTCALSTQVLEFYPAFVTYGFGARGQWVDAADTLAEIGVHDVRSVLDRWSEIHSQNTVKTSVEQEKLI